MNYQAANGRPVAWLTFIVGLVLQVMPLPMEISAWRPDWLLLILMCWTLHLPHRYSIFTAFILGVILDVLLGSHLGVNALALSISVYFVLLYQQRLINFPQWQQALVVLAIMILYHLIVFWIEFILGETEFSLVLFYPAFASFIFWRWGNWMIRRIALKYRVT
ncbi:rod shape-determining protein MreD [Parashewanella spongiae]|uniref:Rod shape-determining protein MreD n=1 Tax=Parashewanella spongiae TaxID=342950 RepID=A0A3A6TR09_9GAMM|nr:rod shape-determining protein MreD [Parashewanella spongiae]MCL1078254.1 rod shape-determining protein MreD [Parashewanella spongiae]RJY15098.1 rod shape-determining protein MreD [Parashewanella spongiae]